MRVMYAIVLVFLSLAAIGCTEKLPTTEERFKVFLENWQAGNYGAMYDMVTAEAQKKITKDDFIKRYQAIYDGIEAQALKLTPVSAQAENPASKATEAKVGYMLQMLSVAGEIKVTNQATLQKEKHGDTEGWYINWTPAMIFPQMNEGDKVKVYSTPSKRGQIIDRNGNALATTADVLEIGIVPGKYQQNSAEVKQSFSQTFHLMPEEVDKKLQAKWVKPDHFVGIATITLEDQRFEQVSKIPGVTWKKQKIRNYPYKEATAHLVGYIGEISAEELAQKKEKGYQTGDYLGKSGLEQIYEDRLRGKAGAKVSIVDADGEEKQILAERQVVSGENILLTIDAQLQQQIYQEMKEEAGAAAAIQPMTGDVLALVSTPSYDPNQIVMGVSRQQWKEWNDDPRKPLLNRFSHTYAPGSTFKALTGAIGLETKQLIPSDAKQINGKVWQKDASWGGYYVTRVSSPNTPINLQKALLYSDNIYFAQAALAIGKEKFTQELKRFGFDEKLPFPYPIYRSTVANGDGVIRSEIQLADSGYGQGEVQMSPLHVALAYTSFVNQGSMVSPKLLLDPTEKRSYWKENVMSQTTAETIKQDLIEVVENPLGTGHTAKISGVRLAGKTGTAELKQKKGEFGKENGWFAAFNVDSPRLLVALMIEDVNGRGGSHYLGSKIHHIFQNGLQNETKQ